jgi:hypothetical protein
MRFKVGDKVRVWKPKDINEFPMWVENCMDKFDGKTGVIKLITNIYGDVVIDFGRQYRFGYKFWYFNERWLTHTNNFRLDIVWM